MLFGVYPYDGNSDNEILNKISTESFKLPKTNKISKTCRQIITQFLDKNPNTRLDLSSQIFEIWYEEDVNNNE